MLPPPPWITRPDLWPRLSRVIQAALASSSETAEGHIVGAKPFLTKQIETRSGRDLAALRGKEAA